MPHHLQLTTDFRSILPIKIMSVARLYHTSKVQIGHKIQQAEGALLPGQELNYRELGRVCRMDKNTIAKIHIELEEYGRIRSPEEIQASRMLQEDQDLLRCLIMRCLLFCNCIITMHRHHWQSTHKLYYLPLGLKSRPAPFTILQQRFFIQSQR